jgi:hypothetical protein
MVKCTMLSLEAIYGEGGLFADEKGRTGEEVL